MTASPIRKAIFLIALFIVGLLLRLLGGEFMFSDRNVDTGKRLYGSSVFRWRRLPDPPRDSQE